MSRYSLQEFVTQTAQKDRGEGVFELESDRMLEVNLNGLVWMKMGAMVAYRGQIKFTREGTVALRIGLPPEAGGPTRPGLRRRATVAFAVSDTRGWSIKPASPRRARAGSTSSTTPSPGSISPPPRRPAAPP